MPSGIISPDCSDRLPGPYGENRALLAVFLGGVGDDENLMRSVSALFGLTTIPSSGFRFMGACLQWRVTVVV